ncbi:MAG: type II secretion system protein [Candidatus Azambacteria bacterium]|nr:type II secretion system protein [Candidatus Azambacteria bacterium]
MNKGFTVVEIVVVLGIMVIITGIALFNAGSEKQDSALFRSAQNLSLNLRKVENNALSSRVFKDRVPCGWGVHFNWPDLTSYTIFADTAINDCDGVDRDYKRDAGGSEDLVIVNFEAGIKIDGITNNVADIVFIPPAPSVVFTSSSGQEAIDAVQIILSNKKFSTREITINAAGFISSP